MQPIKVFLINLDRSRDRLEAVLSSAAKTPGIDVIRVQGVDGSSLDLSQQPDIDLKRFETINGRVPLPGEYGCYASHLMALDRVIDSNAAISIVAEDDISFGPDFAQRVRALFENAPSADLIKLVNHRVQGFVSTGMTAHGDEFGRTHYGPQGSAACYAITHAGAIKLRKALASMSLPYDVALERGWTNDVALYSVRVPLVTLLKGRTQIGSRDAYRAAKRPQWKRVGALAFRTKELIQRYRYASQAKS